MKRDLSTPLVSPGRPLADIQGAALWKLQALRNPWRFTTKLLISQEKRTRTTKEEEIGAEAEGVKGRGGLSISRSPHKYCNCACLERRCCELLRCD